MIYFRVDRIGVRAPDGYDNGGWFLDLGVWIPRPQFLKKLRKQIVRNAMTCTLWVPSFHSNALHFRFNRRWIITHREIMESGR